MESVKGIENDKIMNVANTVSDVVARARAAQAEFETFDQAAIDNAVCALAWVVMEPGRNRLLRRGTRATSRSMRTHSFWSTVILARET